MPTTAKPPVKTKPKTGSKRSSQSSLTPAQNSLYWREWARAKKALVDNLGLSPADAEKERGEITIEALGKKVSSKALTNRQFDKVLASFRAISRPEDTAAQIDAMNQPEKRMRWKIEQIIQELEMPAHYVDATCEKIVGCNYKTADCNDLRKILAAFTKHRNRLKKAS